MDWIIWVVLGVLLVIVFVLPLFTRRKQQGQVNQMLSNVEVGDKIKTVGGIIGYVVKVEQTSPVDKEFVIETGDENKMQIRLDINAIYQVMNKANAPAAPAAVNTEAKTDKPVADVFENTEKTEVKEEVKTDNSEFSKWADSRDANESGEETDGNTEPADETVSETKKTTVKRTTKTKKED